MKLKFSVLGEPAGKGRPRFRNAGAFVQTYTPEKTVSYSCDCCGKDVSFPFDSEDIDSKAHRKELRERLGWITTKVDGEWHDFCCEACRNKYIRDTTK